MKKILLFILFTAMVFNFSISARTNKNLTENFAVKEIHFNVSLENVLSAEDEIGHIH